MSFTNQTKKNTYSGDGVTAAFAFSFPILAETDLLVQIKDTNGTVTSKTITTHYTVSGTGNRTGFTDYTSGTVTFTAGNIPAATDTVIIKRNLSGTQETDYTEKGAFPAETHERALDKLTMLHLQQQEEVDRVIKFDSAVSGVDSTLPTPVADKYLKINSAADGFELASGTSINVSDDTTPQLGGDLDLNSNNITGTGNVNITGNVSLTGTVDGRDVAADGTKLDGIETAADVTDETNVKAALDGATITGVTAATGDKVLIQDVDDSDNLKIVTVKSLLGAQTNVDTVRAYLSSDQSLASSTFTKIQLNAEDFDTASSFDNTTNYRWTPQTAGKYLVIGSIYLSSPTDGALVAALIYKNGSQYSASDLNNGGTSEAVINTTTIVSMNGTTDYLELYGYHTSGANRNVSGSSVGTYLTGFWIGS